MGSYQAPMALRQAVEAADLAAGETARYRASTIMAVAQLEAVEGAILCRGQVREHEQNPEAEEFDIIYQPYAES